MQTGRPIWSALVFYTAVQVVVAHIHSSGCFFALSRLFHRYVNIQLCSLAGGFGIFNIQFFVEFRMLSGTLTDAIRLAGKGCPACGAYAEV